MPQSRAAKRFEQLYRRIREDIFEFCRALNFNPTFQQRQLFEALQRGDRRIAVRSGQGPGKTTASVIAGLFLMIRNPFSRLVVTAPTMRQCREVWLAEARNRLRVADPTIAALYHVTGSAIGVCGYKPAEWGCLLVTSTKPENAQGQHNQHLNIICEEASGVPRPIIEQYAGTLTNKNALFLQIGNPNTRDCAFFDCFNKDAHRWRGIHWNAEETPESQWFSHERNREFAEKYGADSDAYRIRVKGDFPLQDPDCVMSDEQVLAVMGSADFQFAMTKVIDPVLGRPAKQFGLDFARFGGDESTIYRRYGNAIMEFKHMRHCEPVQVVREAFKMQARQGWSDKDTWFVPDAGGMGQGVMSHFHEANKLTLEFHNNGKPNSIEYDNKITEAYFNLAFLCKSKKAYLPRDDLLLQQLTTRRYYMTLKGRLSLESKDDYIKRGHDSPDRADGAVQCFYDKMMADGKVSRAA